MKIEKKVTVGEMLSTLIAIIAILSATWISWISIKENNKNIENTSRAFVFMDMPNMTITTNSDDELIVSLPWKNYGATPAINVITSENSGTYYTTITNESSVTYDDPMAFEKDFKFPDQVDPNGKVRNTLAPGASLPLRKMTLPFNQIRILFETHLKLYTWAWVEYNDVFSSDRHRTEFCVELTIDAISPEIVYTEEFCNKFNGFDQSSLQKPKTLSD